MNKNLEYYFEKLLFASRWLLAPIFIGLSLALLALGFKFFQQAWEVFHHLVGMAESDLVLTVLAMIDIALVATLIIMVMFSGYENFVSTIDAKGSDSLNWLGKLDAGTLKLKVAASIVAISSLVCHSIFPTAMERSSSVFRPASSRRHSSATSAAASGVGSRPTKRSKAGSTSSPTA